MSLILQHLDLICAALALLLGVSESLPFIKGTPAEGVIHGIVVALSKKKAADAPQD